MAVIILPICLFICAFVAVANFKLNCLMSIASLVQYIKNFIVSKTFHNDLHIFSINIMHGNEFIYDIIFMQWYKVPGSVGNLLVGPSHSPYTALTYQHHFNMPTYSTVPNTVPGTTLVCPYMAYKKIAWCASMIRPRALCSGW